MKRVLLLSLALGSVVAVGCSGDTQTSATKDEQNSYANPVKEPPAGASMMAPPGSGGGAAAPPGGAPPPPPAGAQAGPG
jgi:hypothetical protein